MMNLYEINEAIEAAYLQAIDQETGEVNEEALAALDQLEMERDRKVEYIACLIKNLRAEAAALKAEKDAFAKRQKQTENHVEGLSRYLQAVLNGEKFTSDRCAVTFRRSTRVELDPGKTVFDIDASYWRLKDPELDKTAQARRSMTSTRPTGGSRIRSSTRRPWREPSKMGKRSPECIWRKASA